MWPSSEPKSSSDQENPQPTASSLVEMPGTPARASSGGQTQHSVIGASIKIKGTVSASDPVYVYGCVEGSITAPAHRVTVGKEGRVKANISAREVVIMGDVHGNLESGERVEIRCDGSLTGDLVTRRIFIEEGATLSGSIDVQKPKKAERVIAQEEPAAVLEAREPKPERDLDREAWADLAVSEIA